MKQYGAVDKKHAFFYMRLDSKVLQVRRITKIDDLNKKDAMNVKMLW